MSIAFLVTTLIVVATPGTDVIYTLSAGLSRGRRASVVAATGCTLGIVPHMVATIIGLAALLRTSALAFQVLKYLGVVYLLAMAWVTLKRIDQRVDPREGPLFLEAPQQRLRGASVLSGLETHFREGASPRLYLGELGRWACREPGFGDERLLGRFGHDHRGLDRRGGPAWFGVRGRPGTHRAPESAAAPGRRSC
jgi:hypothetical protein